MSNELKERKILKLILIMRFVCATLDVGHPIFPPIDGKSRSQTKDLTFLQDSDNVLPKK
jgi:hypothetical protein